MDFKETKLDVLERSIDDIVDRGYRVIIDDIDRCLKGMIESTLVNAEYVQKSVSVALSNFRQAEDNDGKKDRNRNERKRLQKKTNFPKNWYKCLNRCH